MNWKRYNLLEFKENWILLFFIVVYTCFVIVTCNKYNPKGRIEGYVYFDTALSSTTIQELYVMSSSSGTMVANVENDKTTNF